METKLGVAIIFDENDDLVKSFRRVYNLSGSLLFLIVRLFLLFFVGTETASKELSIGIKLIGIILLSSG